MEVQVIKDRWVKGWEAIEAFTGTSQSTIENLHEKYSFPLRRLPPDGRPVVIISEANEWLRAYTELSSPFRHRRLTGAALQAEMKRRIEEEKRKHEEVISHAQIN